MSKATPITAALGYALRDEISEPTDRDLVWFRSNKAIRICRLAAWVVGSKDPRLISFPVVCVDLVQSVDLWDRKTSGSILPGAASKGLWTETGFTTMSGCVIDII